MDQTLTKRSGTYMNDLMTTDFKLWSDSTGPPSTHQLLSDSQRLRHREQRWFRGQDIQNFHKLKRSGALLPMTQWTQCKMLGDTSGVYDYTYDAGNDATLHEYVDGSYGWVPGSSTWITEEYLESLAPSAYDMYVQEAAAKIYSSGFDALTTIAELAEVRSLFKTSLKKLLTLRLPKNWRDVSNEWLSWRYGWRILYYDIIAIDELLQSFDEKRTRYSEQCGRKYTTHDVIEETPWWSNNVFSVDRTITDKIDISMRGHVVADIIVPKLQFNPLATAWEVIPLSFVVDWFFSVGKMLSAISFFLLQTDYSACKGYRVDVSRKATAEMVEPKDIYESGTVHLSLTDKASYEVRVPCNVPIAPHLTCRLNTFKVFDLMALVLQRFRR